MPPDIRRCVHEFGLTVVNAMLEVGVNKASHIRHLVQTIREGSVEIGNRNIPEDMNREHDRRLAGRLASGGYLVVPKIPTQTMIESSINALDEAGISHTNVDRSRKHAVRLIHANVAGHKEAFREVS